jgi:hypothetical protein
MMLANRHAKRQDAYGPRTTMGRRSYAGRNARHPVYMRKVKPQTATAVSKGASPKGFIPTRSRQSPDAGAKAGFRMMPHERGGARSEFPTCPGPRAGTTGINAGIRIVVCTVEKDGFG